jgi:hypothetical protein
MASSKKKSKIVRDSSDFDESCMTIGNDDKVITILKNITIICAI